MKITGVYHTSYTVSNLERSLEFYAGLLGCEVLWQREITNQYFREIVGFPDCVVKAAHLRIPGSAHVLELFEYVTPRGTPADVRTNNPGSSHLSLYVEDLPAAYEELQARGIRFRSPPVAIDAGVNKGGYALYMFDPDGISVELFQPPKGDRT
jgi:catechol 2,3-dioxygenase-like lactoylglutathione lyase family enzyme